LTWFCATSRIVDDGNDTNDVETLDTSGKARRTVSKSLLENVIEMVVLCAADPSVTALSTRVYDVAPVVMLLWSVIPVTSSVDVTAVLLNVKTITPVFIFSENDSRLGRTMSTLYVLTAVAELLEIPANAFKLMSLTADAATTRFVELESNATVG